MREDVVRVWRGVVRVVFGLLLPTLVVTLAIPGAAVADEVNWVVLMRAGSGGTFSSPTNSGHNSLALGTRPTTTDGFNLGVDGQSAIPPAPPAGSDTGAKAAWYRPDWPVTDPFVRFDYKAPLTPGEVKTWTDMIVWAGPDYAQSSIILNFYTTTTQQAPLSIGGKKVVYKVQLTYAPAGYNGPTEWIFENYGTQSGSSILLGQIELPVLPGVKIANPISGTGPLAATQVGGYRLTVLAGDPPKNTFNPANGHYYEFVRARVTWGEARDLAAQSTFNGMRGHLATITSLQEQEWVAQWLIQLFPDTVIWWIGGYQDKAAPDYSEPAGGWRWVTGEPWSFAAWRTGEPNNCCEGEDYLEIRTEDGYWCDIYERTNHGFIVEYEPSPDLSPPTTPVVTDTGRFTSSASVLSASWSSTDPESGIVEYQYAIGTSPTDPGSGYV
ncbi:MAG: hypothetical protein WHZ52_09120, partial [Armatimonadota bacterium]